MAEEEKDEVLDKKTAKAQEKAARAEAKAQKKADRKKAKELMMIWIWMTRHRLAARLPCSLLP